MQARVDAVLGDLGVTIEASNQARVHLWYESYFGHPYEPLCSSCDGIDRFLVPATCVGVRPGDLYAPNGLTLLYEGILTMNPLGPHRDLFERKAASYRERWPCCRFENPHPSKPMLTEVSRVRPPIRTADIESVDPTPTRRSSLQSGAPQADIAGAGDV